MKKNEKMKSKVSFIDGRKREVTLCVVTPMTPGPVLGQERRRQRSHPENGWKDVAALGQVGVCGFRPHSVLPGLTHRITQSGEGGCGQTVLRTFREIRFGRDR